MRKILFTKRFIITLIWIFILMLIYSLLRFGFFISHYETFKNISSIEIVTSFIKGTRFDLSAILSSNLLLIIIYNLPFIRPNFKLYRIFLIILFILTNLFFIALNLTDYGYYTTTQRRITYEIFAMAEDVIRFFPALVVNHYFLSGLMLILIIIFSFFTVKFLNFLYGKIHEYKSISTEIISFILIIGFTIIGIRGGLQLRPIRPADAFISDKPESSYLTLNTTFNVITSIFQNKIPEIKYIPNDEAITIVRDYLRTENESFVSEDYPFQRKKHSFENPKKLNLVIFIMESWSAKYCGYVAGEKSLTPFFDSIASKGMLFTKFLANGQRSIEAVPSILASVPSLFNTSIINSSIEMNRFRGLGSILLENGYNTSFHHAATTGSMGFLGFTKICGLLKYYGKENFKDTLNNSYDGAWGIYDEPFFIYTADILNSTEEPFFATIFSLSSHDPFILPEDRKDFFEKYKGESELELSIRYSDYSLKRFFDYVKNFNWFDNTIFIITSDHTLYNTRTNFLSTYHIPFLIYSPKHIPPTTNNRVSSHVDILPTVLDLLNISTIHSSMGKSLLDTNKSNFAFEKWGNLFCVFSDSLVLLTDFDNQNILYNYTTDTTGVSNLSEVYRDEYYKLKLLLTAYTQITTCSLVNNKIYFDSK
ncbi:MAG: sulfatase-like hydrolase/transferase [Ignavibacteria bacterium]|nr:sulfatase-like hydrolase/transferase [Ignavibacteria bacterium]